MYTNGRSLSSDTDFYKRQQEAIRQAKAAAEYSQSRSSNPTNSNSYSESIRRPYEAPAHNVKEEDYPKEPERDKHKQDERGLSGLKNTISDFLKNIKEDDILIIALFFLLFNENKEDDFLILIILAILFFS
ncbi:MAG: hypothetical protein K0S55_438 [Clostridia bacterium]|nr:hypothetical protein [Clostridia bacterium]